VDELQELHEILSYPQAALPPDLKRAALQILEAAWPSGRSLEERLSRPLHDPRNTPECMLLRVKGEVVAYLAIPTKTIEHAGVPYTAAGLSAVATHRAHQRRGYAGRLVTAARERIAAAGIDLGVFTCDTPLAPFYVARGWELMPSTVVVGGSRGRPFRADSMDKRTLMGFFTPHAQSHRAAFEDADIYLELRDGDLW